MGNVVKEGTMKAAALLGLPEGMEIDQIQITEASLVVSVISSTSSSSCPLCLQSSSHIHSYYRRSLKDAPYVGRQFRLSVRKFLCRHPDCERQVFAERIPDLADLVWGDRGGRVRDPLGNIWWIQTRVEQVDEEEIAKRVQDQESLDAIQYTWESLDREMRSRGR
jgi:hypothetical protein